MKQLGRISFTDADAIDRAINQNSVERPERRHQFRRVRALTEQARPAPVFAVVCPGCQIYRTPHEMAGHRLCNVCRGRGRA